MDNKFKLETITNLFDGTEIRSVWDAEKEDYYFSVVDVISALTESNIPKRYWADLKRKLTNEGSQVYEKIVRLKILAKDGKSRLTDVLDTEGILRLIESVPSPKAEPFKIWLARLGREEVDNVFDPSKGIDKMIDYYLKKGYTLDWVEARIKAIINRKKLTSTWASNGVESNIEYAILTNEIYKSWSGMSATDYKKLKGIRKESLRDNMTDIEILLTDLGELTTRDIARQEQPQGLKENLKVAKRGGTISKIAKEYYEKETKNNAITSDNAIGKRNLEKNKKLLNEE